MSKVFRIILWAFLFAGTGNLFAQEIKPKGIFLQDSIKIGEVVPYSFSYVDHKNRPVIFPDTTFNFAPFEIVDKEYYDTKSDTLNSIDSAVYYLTTFELDSVQRLALPVFVLQDGDSIRVTANTDSIFLKEVVTQLPDSVNLEENAYFQPVSMQFNYPYVLVGLITLGILALVVLLVYGKRISKKIKLYRLRKKLEKFRIRFDQEVSNLNNSPTKERIEEVLKFWKTYMEGLEQLPYTKLTTKEIVILQQNSSLEETLKSIDRNIYSRITVTALQEDFDFLKDYSQDRYNHVTETIKNA